MKVRDALEKAAASFHKGDLKQVESICRKVLKAHREQPDALHLLGVVALQRSDHNRAVELIEKALKTRPRNASYEANLGEAYIGLGQLDHAVTVFERALEIDPNRAEAYCGLGNAKLALEKVDDALLSYARAIQIDPTLAQAHYNKGAAHSRKGEADDAISAYRQAIALRPSFADAHFNLGNLLSARGEQMAASNAYENAVEAEPSFVKAWYNLGNALSKLGRLEMARQAYARALELDESLAGAHVHLGTIAKIQGRLDNALGELERAIEIEPNNALAHCEKAHVLLLQGQTKVAIAGYQRAIEIEPTFAWAYVSLSGALAAAEMFEEAREVSQQAVRLRRTFAWPFLGRNAIGRVLVLKTIESTHFRIDPDDSIAAIGAMNKADFFFDRTRFQQASFYMDGLNPSVESGVLPECDVIFNAISDVDLVPKSHEIAKAIAADATVPIINAPEIVANSQRHKNYLSFRDLDGVIFPATIRLEERLTPSRNITADLEDAGISFPVLIRRVGTHTGESLEKVDRIEQLESYFGKHRHGPYYIAAFRDLIDDRGAYLKMRAFMIDGELYPSQFLVSDTWNVNVGPKVYQMMSEHDWMLESAEHFFADPESYLGTDAYRALVSIREKLPLDFFWRRFCSAG